MRTRLGHAVAILEGKRELELTAFEMDTLSGEGKLELTAFKE